MADPLSITASIVALVQLSQSLTKYAKEVKNATRECEQLKREVDSARIILEQVQSWSNQTSIDKLCLPGGPVEQLSHVIGTLEGMLESRVNSRHVQRLAWPFKKKDIDALIGVMERLKTLFIFALAKDGTQLNHQIANELENISSTVYFLRNEVGAATHSLQVIEQGVKNLQSDLREAQSAVRQVSNNLDMREVETILEWLCPMHILQQQQELLSAKQRERMSGTNLWILTHPLFTQWLSLAAAQRFLLCQGPPGVGKSVLSASVVGYLRENFPESVVIPTFFVYGEGSQSSSNILSFQLHQLVIGSSGLPEALRLNYTRSKASKSGSISSNEVGLIIQDVLKGKQTVFLVFDALDELDAEERSKILEFVSQMPENVRTFMTSRYLDKEVDRLPARGIMEIESRETDIATYIDQRLASPDFICSAVRYDEEFRVLIKRTLIEKSQGVFLLARLHMDSIAKKPRKKLVINALLTLPCTLDGIYNQALERFDADLKEIAHQTLVWLSFAFEPLSMHALQIALSTDIYDLNMDENDTIGADLITSVCAGFIRIETETGHVRLVHESVRDYVQRNISAWLPDVQLYLAKTCAATLFAYNSEEFHIQAMKKSTLDSHKYFRNSILGYAFKHVLSHAKMSDTMEMNRIWTRLLADDRSLHAFKQLLVLEGYWSLEFPGPFWTLCFFECQKIHVSVSFNALNVVQNLLDEGISADAATFSRYPGPDGAFFSTPLHLAVELDHPEMVELLLSHGADWSLIGHVALYPMVAAGPADVNAFQLSVVARKHPKVVEAFLHYEPDTNSLIKAGDGGVLSGRLMNYGPIFGNRDGFSLYPATFLEFAILVDTQMLIRLISKGLDVSKLRNGQAPLHELANPAIGPSLFDFMKWERKIEVMQVLLSSGADVNQLNAQGKTPLDVAVESLKRDKTGDNTNVMEFLLQHGGRSRYGIADEFFKCLEGAAQVSGK